MQRAGSGSDTKRRIFDETKEGTRAGSLVRSETMVMKYALMVTVAFGWCARRAVADGECETVVTETVSLGSNPLNGGLGGLLSGERTLDMYFCAENNGEDRRRLGDEEGPPLVVLATGAPTPPSIYGEFSTKLVKHGFVVAIIGHQVAFGPGATLNLATSVDVVDAIDFASDPSNFDEYGRPDVDRIVLLGHSFGGGTVMYAMSEFCPVLLCGYPQVDVPLPPEVKAVLGFGTSLVDPATNAFTSGLDNVKADGTPLPFSILVGHGDASTFDILALTGKTHIQSTFDALSSPVSVAVLDDLDHFSICDLSTDPLNTRSDVLSTLPRDQQIDRVATAVVERIDFVLDHFDDQDQDEDQDEDQDDLDFLEEDFCDSLADELPLTECLFK